MGLNCIGSISSGVPQVGILSSHYLSNIFTADKPITLNITVADYADNKVIFMNDNPLIVSANLQTHLDLMKNWYTKWRFKLNHRESINHTFTLRPAPSPEVTLYGVPFASSLTDKYLGLILDKY